MNVREKIADNTVDKKAWAASAKARTLEPSPSTDSPIGRILLLQRTIGNQAVQRLLRSGIVQARYNIGQSNDIYEKEAGQVAGHAMRKQDNKAHSILPIFETPHASFKTRSRYDFNQVLMHSDARVAASTRGVNARPFTAASDAVGEKLFSPELVHVVRQAGRESMINCWSQEGVAKILCETEGKQFIDKLNKLKIYEFKSIKWKYKYVDKEGNIEVLTEESRGETDPEKGEVYIKLDDSDKEAASTLFHEVTHIRQKEKKPDLDFKQNLESEYDAWIKEEERRIRVGLPEKGPGFRKKIKVKRGKKDVEKEIVNEEEVKKYVKKLYERIDPEQVKKYSRIGYYPDGVKMVEKPWKCPKFKKTKSKTL